MKLLFVFILYLQLLFYTQVLSAQNGTLFNNWVDSTILVEEEDYQGVIFPKEFDPPFRLGIETLDNRFTPTLEEIRELETQLIQQLNKTLRKDPRVHGFRKIKDVRGYLKNKKRQYLGYINHQEHKVVYVRLLNFKDIPAATANFGDWKHNYVTGSLRFFKINMHTYEYDLNSKKLRLPG